MSQVMIRVSSSLAVPTVHLNGTSKQELLEQQSNARHKISEAITALRHTAPHGRDYYVQGNSAFREAQKQHCNRVRQLEAVLNELLQISLAVDKQGK